MSEETQMDTLAYSSRMLGWAPMGKFAFACALIIVNLSTSSMLVPLVTLPIGLILMAYSTNFRIPFFIGLALAEAVLIIVLFAGMMSISGTSGNVVWEADILWIHARMTDDSFNYAWLVLLRSLASIAVMISFATSTPIPHLSQAFRQVRMPVEITEIVVLIYRYGFLLLERMEVMWSAASCRMGFNGAKRSISTVASIAVGIFISSSDMADKAQTALECRNYQGYFPVYNQPPKMGVKWLAVCVFAFVAIYLFGLRTEGMVDMYAILSGVLR